MPQRDRGNGLWEKKKLIKGCVSDESIRTPGKKAR